jgi:hypothetical protein
LSGCNPTGKAHALLFTCLQIYFYFYSLLRAGVVSASRKRRGLPPVSAGSVAARTEDIGVPASLLVAAVAGAVNMVITSPAQVRTHGRHGSAAEPKCI